MTKELPEPPHEIMEAARRYAKWVAFADRQRSRGYKGLIPPYDGATDDAIRIARWAAPLISDGKEPAARKVSR